MLTYLTASLTMVAIAKLGIYGYVVGEAVAVVTALWWSDYSRQYRL